MKTHPKTVSGIKHPRTLISLREKLGQKAKREPKFRFYSLYGHLVRSDVLWAAWKTSRRNNGAAGIDGITYKDIENSPGGPRRFLEKIQKSLQEKTYRADPIKRVYILENKLELKLNPEKTKTVHLHKGEPLDFLGYTFRSIPLVRNPRKRYCNYKVSKKAMIKARETVKTLAKTIGRRVKVEDFIPRLNLYLDGWGRCFSKGYLSKEFGNLNQYVKYTVRKQLIKKSQRGYKIGKDTTWNQYLKDKGLLV